MKNKELLYRIPSKPQVTIPDSVDIPMAAEKELSNGARIYVLPDAGRDVVRFSFVFRAGTSWQAVPFSASATANTLSEGSKNMGAERIAEKLDFYGSYFDVNIDRDYSVVTFVCLARFFEKTIEVAREVLLNPVFPEREVRIYCEKSRERLIINRTKTDFLAREYFAAALYGENHPYGASSPASMYDALTPDDLRRFYSEHYTAASCFVVMSGDTTPERQKAVEELAMGLPEGEKVGREGFPVPKAEKFRYAEHPGAVQSSIRIGSIMFPRTDPDFIPMQVVTTLLGGYFGSRFIQNLREEHGYTYGAYSAMVNFDRSGYMAIATDVGGGFTEDAVRQIFHEMERLRTEMVPETELQLVKNIMAGEVMRILDGPFGIADVTIENVQNGRDNGYLTEFTDRIKGFTPADVKLMAAKYLAPENFTAVIVGCPGARFEI